MFPPAWYIVGHSLVNRCPSRLSVPANHTLQIIRNTEKQCSSLCVLPFACLYLISCCRRSLCHLAEVHSGSNLGLILQKLVFGKLLGIIKSSFNLLINKIKVSLAFFICLKILIWERSPFLLQESTFFTC